MGWCMTRPACDLARVHRPFPLSVGPMSYPMAQLSVQIEKSVIPNIYSHDLTQNGKLHLGINSLLPTSIFGRKESSNSACSRNVSFRRQLIVIRYQNPQSQLDFFISSLDWTEFWMFLFLFICDFYRWCWFSVMKRLYWLRMTWIFGSMYTTGFLPRRRFWLLIRFSAYWRSAHCKSARTFLVYFKIHFAHAGLIFRYRLCQTVRMKFSCQSECKARMCAMSIVSM